MANSMSCYLDGDSLMEFHSWHQLVPQPESPTPSLPDTEWTFPDHEIVSPRPSLPDTEWNFPNNNDFMSSPETELPEENFKFVNDSDTFIGMEIVSFTMKVFFCVDGNANVKTFYLTLPRIFYLFDYISYRLGCTTDYLTSRFRVLLNGWLHMSPLDILGEDLHMAILLLIG